MSYKIKPVSGYSDVLAANEEVVASSEDVCDVACVCVCVCVCIVYFVLIVVECVCVFVCVCVVSVLLCVCLVDVVACSCVPLSSSTVAVPWN